MTRALPLAATIISGIFVVGVWLQPINSTITRSLLLFALLVFGLCLFAVSAGHRVIRGGLIFLALIVIVFVALPGGPPNRESLKARYLDALIKYVDAPYVWGGERASGIDCSGLPRKALRDALFQEGIRTLNGALIRQGLLQWWFDVSAASLAAGYRNYVVPTRDQGRIRDAKFTALRPGDVAITNTGVHCLVYLRDSLWIEADPGLEKVAILDTKKSDNSWFDSGVKMYRWSVFESR